MTSLNDPSYVRDQYRASGNLEARIALHERFSTAKQKWFDWYWTHLDLPINARILEVGCGVGMLWRDNRAQIPSSWQITLFDFSLGMMETTRAANVRAGFLQSDAQWIPFSDSTFDAVIANHMLYHVPDVSHALSEFRRVLKPSGKLYAATNGESHMREYFQLVADFLTAESMMPQLSFTLENGAAQLAQYFSDVRRIDFDDALIVTQVEPLVAYAVSGMIGRQIVGRENVLRDFITERIARDGAFYITKATGLFVATD